MIWSNFKLILPRNVNIDGLLCKQNYNLDMIMIEINVFIEIHAFNWENMTAVWDQPLKTFFERYRRKTGFIPF